MDDFRLGSILPSDPYQERLSGPANREKRPRKRSSEEDQPAKEDEFVASPEQAEAESETVEDSYSPSRPAEESE